MTARILFSLLLGALTTWLIAILCAASISPTMISGAAGPKAPTWTFRQWRTFGHISNNFGPAFDDRKILGYEGPKPALVPSWSHMHRPPVQSDYDPASLNYVWWNETGLGWPLCTFIHTTTYDGRSNTPNFIIAKSGALEYNLRNRAVHIPYIPNWSGFITTTLLLALPWYALLIGPGALRRHHRRHRGLCLGCGYDLRSGGRVCPECGRDAGQNSPRVNPSE